MNRLKSAARTVFAALGLVLALHASAALAAVSIFPPLTGRVVDNGGILSADAQTRLTAMSQALENKTHDQLVVVTLKSLQGLEIEQYGYQLGRAWGIGQKGKNSGVLLIIAPNEHKVRIEVGYGLEGDLTDAQSKLIIDNVILPDFKKGAFDTGALAGAATILNVFGVQTADVQKVLQQQEKFAQSDEEDNNNDHGGFPIIVAAIIIWFVFGRFLWPLLFLGGGRGGWGGGSFGGFGGAGGGFSGGGFSGGGGSFGGGGASGSW